MYIVQQQKEENFHVIAGFGDDFGYHAFIYVNGDADKDDWDDDHCKEHG